MPDPTTSRTGIPYPVGGDLVSAGPAEMNALATKVDTLWGLEFTDILQAGIVGNAALANATGPSVNSSTGTITVTLNADVAWVPVAGTLTRCVLPTSSTALPPSSLPGSGTYASVGVYVTPASTWGTTGSLSTAVGTFQGTQAAAIANPPATPSGTVLIEYVILANGGGVYSIATTVDGRVGVLPVRAKTVYGGNSGADYNTTSGSFAAIDPTNLSIVLPVLAGPLEIGFDFHYISNGSSVGNIDFTADGTEIDGKYFILQYPPVALTPQHHSIVFKTSGVTAGSHTFQPRWRMTSGVAFYIANGGSGAVGPASFWVRQIPEAV